MAYLQADCNRLFISTQWIEISISNSKYEAESPKGTLRVTKNQGLWQQCGKRS
jgi:hypothetical protein